jgi:hypothetical protein
MPSTPLDYSRLVERALRRVVKDALAEVAEQGLPGQHHLYLTFRTDHPGVVIDDGLRARYPSEMTIVLQFEFWGLDVGEEGFGITLSFGGQPQRLEIPFAAIRVFADPSVEFGLQFTVPEGPGAGAGAPPAAPPAIVAELGPAAAQAGGATASAAPGADPPQEVGSAEVVTLDRFRKK